MGFEIISTLLKYQDKFYKCGEECSETKDLAIRGYESAFLADLVASYLLEVTDNNLCREGITEMTDFWSPLIIL